MRFGILPEYCVCDSGYAFLEVPREVLFGNTIRESARDITKLVLELRGYQVEDKRTDSKDSSVERVIYVADQLIKDKEELIRL